MEINKYHLKYIEIEGSNVGYMLDTVPLESLNEIEKCVSKIQTNPLAFNEANPQLAGQINKEYFFPYPPSLKKYIQQLTEKYNKKCQYINSLNFKYSIPLKLKLSDLWVNFQEKYEYNPIHHHRGIFSFVIWYKIPYYFKDEINIGPGKKKLLSPEQSSTNGLFQFIVKKYQESVEPIDIRIDKNLEGTICIFPSYLSHIVYPFYSSDEPRITIAGNIDASI